MNAFNLDEYISHINNYDTIYERYTKNNYLIEDVNNIKNCYIKNNAGIEEDDYKEFFNICRQIQREFSDDAADDKDYMGALERQKKAIIGYEKEVRYFKEKIREYLDNHHMDSINIPMWYPNLIEGIFQENWGLAGLSEWIRADDDKFRKSSSAKVIGDRIYFMIGGKLELQPQSISKSRRDQLRNALLLKTPKKRLNDDYHEVYLLDGTRITIYGQGRTKEGQDSIVFRKFFVRDYSFERQVAFGSIPNEAVELFKVMIKIGFNVAFTGAVRTAKTTFLTTWQSYEDASLEGVCIETDPEIPFHEIMPSAPILQLVADGENLKNIVKIIMRSDADYIVLGEARDGVALQTAVKIANKGTRRVKMTYHTSDVVDFCYDVADEIVKMYGGSMYSTILKVAKSFQFVFQFIQLSDKSQKRLNGIYEIQYDINKGIIMHRICEYCPTLEKWNWSADIGQSTLNFANMEDGELSDQFMDVLRFLEQSSPMDKAHRYFYPEYKHLKG